MLGDAAYKVWWDTTEARVRITAPDVRGLYVWPCAGDHPRFWKVASRYALSHEEAESTFGSLPARPSYWAIPLVPDVMLAPHTPGRADNRTCSRRRGGTGIAGAGGRPGETGPFGGSVFLFGYRPRHFPWCRMQFWHPTV